MMEQDEGRVLDFGSSLLREVFGTPPGAHVLLAGGAFKSLLHGRAPRDLDLWVLDTAGHEAVTRALVGRGATLLRDNPPYQAAFELNGRVIEVAYPREDRKTMGDVLRHFDIGLSAMGVGWDGVRFRTMVRPEAAESLRRRQVLVIWPLLNWKYVLVTIERMRRYGRELGFVVPDREIDGLWDLFDAQDPDEKARMVDRYLRVGRGDPVILATAERRLLGGAA